MRRRVPLLVSKRGPTYRGTDELDRGGPSALSHALLFAEVGELLSFEVGKLYLSSHKEADDLGFRLGARAHPATHARSPYLAAKPAIKFFTGVEKHLHRLHRLACPARLTCIPD